MAPSQAYKNYLKSKRWRVKREQVFAYYGKRCYACKKTPKVIHCHHLTYARLGHEALGDLRPLCVPCHKQVSQLHWKMGRRTSGFVVFARFMELKSKEMGR